MAIGKALQTNFTSGVLDPKLAAREDITFYYNGLKDALNLLMMPYGGAVARPGNQFVRRLPGPMSALSFSGATATAPQGGTAGNAIDGNAGTALTTTNNLGAINPFVVLHLDFGASVDVDAIDTIDFRLESLALDDEFVWQSADDNATWNDFGTPFNWSDEVRSRRARAAAGRRSAQYWRLARLGVTNIGAKAVVTNVVFYTEGAWEPSVRLVPFSYSTSEAYLMAATAGNMDVFAGDDFQGGIAVAHEQSHLPTINWTQSFDTLILFHRSVPPTKIFRQGGDDEFDFRLVAFENIPDYDYGAGVGGVDEVQTLSFDYVNLDIGERFTLLLEGERTEGIAFAADPSGTANNIQSALRALSNTSATGITVTGSIASKKFTVTFSGDDGKQPWDEMSVSVLSGDAVFSVSRTTKGRYPGEAIMSDARGWPRCGLIDGGRLHLGGVPGVPDAHIMSTTTDYFDLDIERDDDTKGLMFRAETDQVGAIYNIVRGRHVTLFTNDGEFYYPSEGITDESVLKLSTRSGSKEGTRVHEVDGALLFIQGVKDDASPREIGTSLREFIYEETRQSYDANLVSKLSGHLILNPVDNALRKALSTDEADIELLINEDGTGTAYTVLRGDAVNALAPFATRSGDRLLAVAVDKKRRVYFAVERTINGQKVGYLERWNKDLLLDCGGIVSIEAEEIVAGADGQGIFSWSFDNPPYADAIGVRINGGRIEPPSFSVDLGSKAVTLSEENADLIHAGDIVRISRMISQVEGLDHLDGEEVMTVVDGTEGDAVTVVAGVLDLGLYADTEIQYGFDFEVSGKLMPLRIPESETLSGERVRVVNARFELFETGGIEIRANNGRWQEIQLVRMDEDILDRSTKELLYSGPAEKRGLRGFNVGAPLEFRRPGPVPFTVLGVVREVSL